MLHFFYCSLLLPITLSSPLLLYFLFFLYLKRKKEEIIYIFYIYKNWKFDYYTPLTSLFFHFHSSRQAGRYQDYARYKYRCLNVLLFKNVLGGSCIGAKRRYYFLSSMPAYLKRLAGLWELCFVALWGEKETISEIEREEFIRQSSRLAASGAHWFA